MGTEHLHYYGALDIRVLPGRDQGDIRIRLTGKAERQSSAPHRGLFLRLTTEEAQQLVEMLEARVDEEISHQGTMRIQLTLPRLEGQTLGPVQPLDLDLTAQQARALSNELAAHLENQS